MKFIRGLFGLLAALAAGALILWYGGSPVYSWIKVKAGVYVSAQASVQSKGIEKLTSRVRNEGGARGIRTRYCAYIDYAYTVKEVIYIGRHITSADDCDRDQKSAEKLIRGFTVKTKVPIYYDSGNPAASLPYARLSMDRIFSSAVYWLIAIALIALGIVFFLYDLYG